MKTNYDIVIIGGGIVGLTMACLLGDSKLKVAVLDAHVPITAWSDDEYDLRVSAISRGSQKIFQSFDAWSAIRSERISEFFNMHVWDANSEGKLDFCAATIGEVNLGYIIENRVIQKVLYQQLQKYSNINFISTAKLTALTVNTDHALLALNTQQTLTAELVIGADGAESQVRKLAGFAFETYDYEHTALVATVRTEKPHQSTAWQRFLSTGPIAFLPLADSHTCSIVWSTSPQQAEELYQLTKKEFCKYLSASFIYTLGKIESVSERAIFPLRMRHIKNYVQDKVVLIGDAAHTIHPLAGQGVNLGIADAACLARIILAAHSKNRTIGALHTLRPYERARKTENMKMFAVVDGLKKLFANDYVSIQWLRGVGLTVVDKINFVKNYLIRNAMGI